MLRYCTVTNTPIVADFGRGGTLEQRLTRTFSDAGANAFYDFFVDEAIPRNGTGRIYAPTDPPNSNTLGVDIDDGITLEPVVGVNMAWTQFDQM